MVENWGHIIFPSLSILFPWYVPTIKKSFTLTIIKAQEKIAQNTNNLSNPFHGQAQAEYYLVRPHIILMALCSIYSYSLPLNQGFTEPVFSQTSLCYMKPRLKVNCTAQNTSFNITLKSKITFTLYFYKKVLPWMVCYCLNISN